MCSKDTNILTSCHMHDSRMEKMVKFEIKHGLPFMAPDLVYKFLMICLLETEFIEWKPNVGWKYGHG